MRFIAALICFSLTAAASAGDVKIYTPTSTHIVSGTSHVNTVGSSGDFTIVAAAVNTGAPDPLIKAKGYAGFSGDVTTATASVTFQNCMLLNFQGGEQGLLHYEVYCDAQTGNF